MQDLWLMSYKIVATAHFKSELKRLSKKYRSLKTEYVGLLDNLEKNPTFGKHLGNQAYKIRLAIASKNSGKSGGLRIITFVIIADQTIVLLTIYNKSSQSNISTKEITQLIETYRKTNQ